MQRVRIGLTGLAFVFLAVLLAAIATSGPAEEEPITANMIERHMDPGQKETAAEAEPKPKEPLAELGVAPGNVETNGSGDAPAKAPAPE